MARGREGGADGRRNWVEGMLGEMVGDHDAWREAMEAKDDDGDDG